MEKFKQKLAQAIVRRHITLMIAVLILAAAGAAMIGRTNINYDLTRYLAEDTMTRRALTVMEEQFSAGGQLRVMFTDMDGEALSSAMEDMRALPGVHFVSHDREKDVRVADGHTYSLVSLTMDDSDGTALVDRLRGMFPDAGEFYVGGTAAEQADLQRSVAREIPAVMAVSVAVVIVVLAVTSHAWLEPLVILLTLSVSILINMGTNFLFPSVSFVTFAVCAILQLALSIDYAIMLFHAYNACTDEGLPAEEAMAEALQKCFMRIFSSGMTTVAGLMSLAFMSFTFGFDIGVVLSKGILTSMLGVFLFLPAMILVMRRPLAATRHRPVPMGGERLASFLYKARRPVCAVLAVLVLCGVYLNGGSRYAFGAKRAAPDTETGMIDGIFGVSDPIAVMVPGGREDEDYDKQRALAESLAALRRADGTPVVTQIDAMVTDGADALKYYTAGEAAEITGLAPGVTGLIFRLMGWGESVRADRMLEAADRYLNDNETVASFKDALDTARTLFEGPDYSRMLLTPGFSSQDADFRDCMDAILSSAREAYGDAFYITGGPMSVYDIGNAFGGDLTKVNLITLCAILLIVIISFRAFRLPAVLVFVIEGAICVTMGISRLMGQSIFFISYLICLSIQMGATVDYGILLCDQYRTARRTGLTPRDALGSALHKALPTILTSGVILVTAGYAVGKMCSIYYISSIGLLLARGASVSAILVLTLLPALLVTWDRFLIRVKK